MRKRFTDPHKCPNCGYDLRTLSELVSTIKERGDDVQNLIDENHLDFEFDHVELGDALKYILEFEEIHAFPTAVEKIKNLKLLLDQIWDMMDFVQYDDDVEEDEIIRNQMKEDFDKQELKKQIDELVLELKEINKKVNRFFGIFYDSKFSSTTAKKLR